MRTSLGLVVVAATIMGACGAPPAPATSPPKTTTTSAADVRAARAPAAASAAPAPPSAPATIIAPADAAHAATIVEGPPRPAPRCRLTVTETDGCQQDEVEVIGERVRPSIEHCRGSNSGKLNVRLWRGASGKLGFDLVPGPSLDPTERTCIYDALNKLFKDTDSMTAWTGGAALPPTGFTSLLTIEW
jgi:hypothetical protein